MLQCVDGSDDFYTVASLPVGDRIPTTERKPCMNGTRPSHSIGAWSTYRYTRRNDPKMGDSKINSLRTPNHKHCSGCKESISSRVNTTMHLASRLNISIGYEKAGPIENKKYKNSDTIPQSKRSLLCND